MIDPKTVALFIPPELKKFKLNLFSRIGRKIQDHGGKIVLHDPKLIESLPDHVVPIIGCSASFRHVIPKWQARGRRFIFWDRGYFRRVFATWLPRGEAGGFYRWHINSCQMQSVRDVPDDRWRAAGIELKDWNKGGRHIVLADQGPNYWATHADAGWVERTVAELKRYTDREIRIRGKESKVPLYDDLAGTHALVTHGSIAAVESIIMGCPVFVDPVSAAALVGETEFSKIETPIYPAREPWLHSLAYCQFNEDELVDGTLWKLIA